MKKISLFLGALGGGLAGYLFSNRKLRDELAKSKDPKKAAKILGKYLSNDGDRLAKDVKDFLESDQVQGGIMSAKKYASDQYTRAKKEIEQLAGTGASLGAKKAKKGAVKAKKATRRISQKVRKINKS